jgi:RNA polymerase sigma-70 factor (ECF subfamily)
MSAGRAGRIPDRAPQRWNTAVLEKCPNVHLPDLTPHELHALQGGDLGALAAAFRMYGDRVHRTCRNLLGQDADADDATQEVFLRVLDKARTFAGAARFSTWLYRLTVNHCLNLRRRQRSAGSDDPDALPSPLPTPLEVAERADARAELDRVLARLQPDARTVIVLREIEEP